MEIGNIYTVKILKQDYFGRGITRINNMLVFVDNALPEEECEIEIIDIKKKFLLAKINKIITKSSFRQEVDCPYYDICGGCHIMHEYYNKQLSFKENKVKELLNRLTGIDINIKPIISKNQYNYRNKVIFHGSNNKLGFYKEKTNDIVNIDKCIITDNKINDTYKNIKEYLLNNPNTNIDNLLIRKTSLNEIMVVIDGNISLDILSLLDNVNVVYINNKLVKGNTFIEEKINDIIFRIYPKSFFQVNYDMMLELYNLVISYYKDKKYHKVLDLYCGTGTIGMLVSKYVDSVIGVEKEHSSIESANICRKINKINNISFYEGKVEDKIDLFNDIDSIIVDPPRSGLDTHTIDTIIKLNAESIIYVSCNPATLARDLKILLNDYDLIEVIPVDMFPNTYHVECVSVLCRKTLIK